MNQLISTGRTMAARLFGSISCHFPAARCWSLCSLRGTSMLDCESRRSVGFDERFAKGSASFADARCFCRRADEGRVRASSGFDPGRRRASAVPSRHPRADRRGDPGPHQDYWRYCRRPAANEGRIALAGEEAQAQQHPPVPLACRAMWVGDYAAALRRGRPSHRHYFQL